MSSGDKIRILRESRGITQEDLAKKVGYKSRSSIAKIETGESDPSQRMLLKIATALDVSPAELLDESPKNKSSSTSSQQTPTFRIISSGLSELPQEEQEKILNILRAMYANRPELFKRERTNDDTGL